GAVRFAARVPTDQLPGADGRCPHPHGSRRALPRSSGAVQTGSRRARAGRHLRRAACFLDGRALRGRSAASRWPPCPGVTVAAACLGRVGRPRIPGMSTPEPDLTPEGPGEGRAESAAIEAVLTVATEPVPPGLLAELLELPVERVEQLCRELAAGYTTEGRGFVLARVAGGYRFQSSEAYAAFVERFELDGGPQKLSPAALETLAV